MSVRISGREFDANRKLLIVLVPAAGVEPATFRSGGERSNPLSYAGLWLVAEKIAQKSTAPKMRSKVRHTFRFASHGPNYCFPRLK